MANERLDTLISDLKKAIKLNSEIENITTTKIESPVKQLLEYGFRVGIIDKTGDVLKVCKEIPDLEDLVTSMYDKKIKENKASEAKYAAARAEERRKYAGTYDRYEDVPGYGTEWNMRCVPDGVVIRGRGNSRC